MKMKLFQNSFGLLNIFLLFVLCTPLLAQEKLTPKQVRLILSNQDEPQDVDAVDSNESVMMQLRQEILNSGTIIDAFIDAVPTIPHFSQEAALKQFKSDSNLVCKYNSKLHEAFFLDSEFFELCSKSEKPGLEVGGLSLDERERVRQAIKKEAYLLNSKDHIISMNLMQGKRILSVGEGFAGVVPVMNLRGVDAYALDIRESYGQNNHPYLWAFPEKFIKADATKFATEAFAEKKFDHIFGMQLLCDLGMNLSVQAISESLKALKTGGTLRHTWGAEDNAAYLFHEDRPNSFFEELAEINSYLAEISDNETDADLDLKAQMVEVQQELVAQEAEEQLKERNRYKGSLEDRVTDFLKQIKANAKKDGHEIKIWMNLQDKRMLSSFELIIQKVN